MASIGEFVATFKANFDGLLAPMKEAQKQATQFNKSLSPLTQSLKDAGAIMTATGKTMTAAISLPLAALGAVAIKAASDFESSFAGVRKTVDATEQEFAGLSSGLRNMAKELPTSVGELNKIAEAAGQLGIKKQDILAFTKTMADLGVTTNLTSDQAATATAQIQNIFGAAGKEVDRFGATLVALGNAGASTEADIINMSLRIAGAGHQVGLTQAQVLSFASALSSVGINAEAGGSAISRVFLKINDAVASGGAPLAEFARIAGVTASQFKTSFETDAAGATTAFIGGLARIKGEGENVNATLEGLVGKNIIIKDTLLRASGAGVLLADSLKLGDQAWKENTALVNEAAERYKTFESQFQIFKNQLSDVAITLGTAMLPALKSMLDAAKPAIAIIADLAQGFANLPRPIQTFALGLAAVAVAIGPVLLAAGFLTSSVGGLIPVVVRLSTAIAGAGGLSAAATKAGASLKALAISGGPLLLTVAAVAALGVALWKLHSAWKASIEAQGEARVALARQEESTIKAAKALKDHYGIEINRGTMSTTEWGQALSEAAATAAWFERGTKGLTDAHRTLTPAVKIAKEEIKLTEEQQMNAARTAKDYADKMEAAGRIVSANARDSAQVWRDANVAMVESMEFRNRAFSEGLAKEIKDWEIYEKALQKVSADFNLPISQSAGTLGSLIVAPLPVTAGIRQVPQASKEAAEAMNRASEDIKRSAGAIFDAMFIKGENVFTSLGNALKGGALSIGRTIFQDIVGELGGPIKKAFDDFFTGLIEGTGIKSFITGLGDKLGGVLGDLFGGGGGATSVAGGAGGAAGAIPGIGSGGSAAAGGAGAFAGIGSAIAGGIISSIGSFLSGMRLEGTMNAVEANTRFTYIQIKDTMEQILHPMRNFTEYLANQSNVLVNQLDAIFNAVIPMNEGFAMVTESINSGAASIVAAIGNIQPMMQAPVIAPPVWQPPTGIAAVQPDVSRYGTPPTAGGAGQLVVNIDTINTTNEGAARAIIDSINREVRSGSVALTATEIKK